MNPEGRVHRRGAAVSDLARVMRAEGVRAGPLPPFARLSPFSEATGPDFRSANQTFYGYVYARHPRETWQALLPVLGAYLLRQLPDPLIARLASLPAREQSAVVALLPSLWTLHASGPRPEYDLWPRLGTLAPEHGQVALFGRDEAAAVLRVLVDEVPARRAALARRYVLLAIENGPAQGRLADLPPPTATSLLRTALSMLTASA